MSDDGSGCGDTMNGLSLGIPGVGPVTPGTHFCALYSGPVERDRLLYPFLDEGLRHGDKCLCLIDDVELTGPAADRSDGLFETGRQGVFAVGDVRSGSVKRVASAVGEGSVAIRQVHEFLEAEGRR